MMQTILQISVDGNIGSTGRIAEDIGQKVIENGYRSFIANARYIRKSESEIIKIGSKLDILIHGIQTRIFDNHGLNSKKATKILLKKIDEIMPNVIHLHNLHGYYVNYKMLLQYISDKSIPLVMTMHDCWPFTGHCAHFDHINCEKWKTQCCNCPQKKEYPKSYFYDRSKENYKIKKELFSGIKKMVVVSVSKWMDGKVSESFLSGFERRIIYNGINIEDFNNTINDKCISVNEKIRDKFVILGVAGTWTEKKGYFDFIELSKVLNEDEVIVLVGLNKSQIKKAPHNIIALEHIEDRIKMKNIYASADVFLNLSVEESFGLTTIEAMACGIPPVVYKSTASPEVIGEAGYIVTKRNIREVREAISEIKKKGKSKYSSICRNRVLMYFNKEERMTDYINLYKEILAKQHYKNQFD